MKKIVFLDKNGDVTEDPVQAVRAIETEYTEDGHLIEETFYFKKDTPQNKRRSENG